MSIRFNFNTALISCAVFVLMLMLMWTPVVNAQAPIIDASIDSNSSINEVTPPSSVLLTPPPAETNNNSASSQGELFYQLQLLQQEVMQLRGLVEEQSHQLKRAKDQNMERYLDIDKRLTELASKPIASPTNSSPLVSNTTAQGSERGSSTLVVALEGEKQAYDSAYSLVVSKRFYEALESFKQFLIDYPLGRYAPNSYYWMGELYQVVKPQDLEASRQAFTQLLDQYPDHSKAPSAMYALGKVYYLKDNKRKAREWLEKVIANYGQGKNSSVADKARQFVNTNF